MCNFVQSMGRELEIEILKSLKFIERKTLLWTQVRKNYISIGFLNAHIYWVSLIFKRSDEYLQTNPSLNQSSCTVIQDQGA